MYLCCATPKRCDAYKKNSIRWSDVIVCLRLRICNFYQWPNRQFWNRCVALRSCRSRPHTRQQGKSFERPSAKIKQVVSISEQKHTIYTYIYIFIFMIYIYIYILYVCMYMYMASFTYIFVGWFAAFVVVGIVFAWHCCQKRVYMSVHCQRVCSYVLVKTHTHTHANT